MGQKWFINPTNHVIYWNGAPYVPIGFREAGIEFRFRSGGGLDVSRSLEASKQLIDVTMKAGFNTFCGLKSGGGADFVHNVRKNSLSKGDYYALMDKVLSYLQSKNGYYISEFPMSMVKEDGSWADTLEKSDAISYVNRETVDVSANAGKTRSLKVSRKPHNAAGPVDASNMVLCGAQAYLFDYDQNKMLDVSSRISAFRLEERSSILEDGKKAYELTAELSDVKFPNSRKLMLVVVWQVGYYMIDLDGAGSMPGLWKAGVMRTAKVGLREALPHIKRENLRGIAVFGGEENLYRIYLVLPAREKELRRGGLFSGEPSAEQWAQMRPFAVQKPNLEEHYPDYRSEPMVLAEYRRWLLERFKNDIASFNKAAGTSYSDFASVDWIVPLRPNNSTKDPDFQKLFGLFHSVESEKAIDELQNAFHHDLYGKWLAEYGKLAKETVGNVPTFSYATDLYYEDFDNKHGLDIHESALIHGIDGIGLSLYENASQLCGDETGSWFNRVRLIDRFLSVEKQTGKTKFMWVFEGAPHDFGNGYGIQEWEGWYNALIRRGVKGFLINVTIGPSNYGYTSQLLARIVTQAVATTSIESNPQGCYSSARLSKRAQEKTEREAPVAGEQMERPEQPEHSEQPEALNLKLTKAALRRIIESDSRVKAVASRYPGYDMEIFYAPDWKVWRVEINARGKKVASASVRDEDGKVVEFGESK